jgi:uncharacterized membrane protein
MLASKQYDRLMVWLRYLGLIALVVWIGGLIGLGIAAPQLFQMLEAHDPVAGRELAGAAFGAIFRHFQPIAWTCGAIIVGVLATRAALGPRPRHLGPRLWTTMGMLLFSIGTTVAIVPRIDRLRESTSGSIANLPADDPRRVEFGRLHGLSNGLMLLTVSAGLALLWFETTDV